MKAQKVAFAAAEGAVGLAAGPLAGVTVKILEVLLPEDAAANAARRIFRRDLYLISDVAAEAAGIATLDTQIEKVWGQEIDGTTRKALDRIARLNADALLRVGSV